MKRAAVLGILVLCVVGVLFLWKATTSDRGDRRDQGAAGTSAGTYGGATYGDDDAGADSDGAGAGTRDDDPNRIDGPPLTLRGRVVLDGGGVAGATVTALRAYPWFEPVNYRWMWRDHELPPPPVGATESGSGGEFELTIPRRRRLLLKASRPGSGYTTLFLIVPEEGNPEEVTLHLREGFDLQGIVVTEKNEPVAGAEIMIATNDYQRPPVGLDAKSDTEGRFAVSDLPRATYRVRVSAASYPTLLAYANPPTQRHLRLVMKAGGVITGKVTDAGGQPVAQARLVFGSNDLDGRGTAETTTDDAGEYRAALYPGSINTIALFHPKYGTRTSARQEIELPTVLVDPETELRHDIKLKPGVAVRGRAVFAKNGTPAAGATITLLQMGQQWRGLTDVDHTKSTEDGTFVFAHVTEGTYGVEATMPGAARRATRWVQAQQPLTIDFYVDGEKSPAELRIELMPTGSVHGTVSGVEPNSGVNTRAQVNMQTAEGPISGAVDDVGSFVLANVPPMEAAVVNSYNPQAKSEPFDVVAGKVTEIHLGTDAQVGVTGRIDDENGNVVRGARVQMMAESQLKQSLKQFLQYAGWGTSRTDRDGRYQLGLGNWQHDYWRSQKFVVVAYHEEHSVSISEAFKLPKENTSAEVNLTLSSGGTVRGHLEFEGAGPAQGVHVVLSPKPEKDAPFERRRVRTGYTDLVGRFEVTGVDRGTYLASASHHSGKVESVEVQAGDEDVRLTIKPMNSISGIVLTKEGKPVSQAQVSAMVPTPTGESKRSTTTNATGRFRIGHLEDGSYALEVAPSQRGYSAQGGFEKKRVESIATGTEELVIKVEEGPVLKGRVVGPRGAGIAGVGVIAMSLKPPKQGARRSGVQNQQNTRPSAVTNGRGEFTIKGAGTEEVELIALAEGYAPATLRAVGGGAPVTMRVEQGGVIEGKILKADGTPHANAWISLNSQSQEANQKLQSWRMRAGNSWNNLGGWSITQGRTNARGEFRVSSLFEGEYRLHTNTQAGVLPPTTLRTGEGSITLRMQKPYTIKGRILDPDGNPIVVEGTQRVWINAQASGQYISGTSADEDGYFELKGVPPGTVSINIWAGAKFKPKKFDATAGEQDVVITLERNAPKPAPDPNK